MYNKNKVNMLSQKFIDDMNKIIAEGNSDLSFGDDFDWFDEEVDTTSFVQVPLFNYEQEVEQEQPNKKIRTSRQPRGYWDEEECTWKRIFKYLKIFKYYMYISHTIKLYTIINNN